jgi:hypothetical protein
MRHSSWIGFFLGAGTAALLTGCPGSDGATGGGGTGGDGGGGGQSTGTSTDDVTWTLLYNTVFGPNGTSNCSANGGCHTAIQNGFKCGTTKASCYDGMVSAGLVTPGSDASSSILVDPQDSPLCGSLGGTMPKTGQCVSDAQIDKIQAWLAAGAPNN